jgi:hypothetical protein
VTDLIRLADDPDVPSELRRALSAEKRKSPPPALATAVWGVVAAQLHAGSAVAAGTASGAATGGASAVTVVSLGTLKAFVLGVGLGTVTLGVSTWIDRNAERPQLSAEAASTSPSDARRTVVKPRVEPAATASEDSAPAPSSTPPALTNRPTLQVPVPSEAAPGAALDVAAHTRIETKLVRDARARLRSGDSAGTLMVLSELDREVPLGVLAQEREALRVEALFALGNIAEGTRAADAFLARHADSPHAGRIRALIQRARSAQ